MKGHGHDPIVLDSGDEDDCIVEDFVVEESNPANLDRLFNVGVENGEDIQELWHRDGSVMSALTTAKMETVIEGEIVIEDEALEDPSPAELLRLAELAKAKKRQLADERKKLPPLTAEMRAIAKKHHFKRYFDFQNFMKEKEKYAADDQSTEVGR